MKKLLILSLLLVLMLSGCAEHPVASAAGDFTFYPPEGYSIEDITDINCTILRETDSTVVGGIEVTTLSRKSLTRKNDNSIILYLQDEFHKTLDVEFILERWNDGDPIVIVHLRKHEDSNSETMFSHIFYEKDSRIYHIWLNEDTAGEEAASDFLKVLE